MSFPRNGTIWDRGKEGFSLRTSDSRHVGALLSCIPLLGLFAYLAMAISRNTIGSFDSPIIALIQGVEEPWLTKWANFLATIGSGSVVVSLAILLAIALFFGNRREQALFVLVVVIGSGALNQILKIIFQRERPTLHRLAEIGGYSFPSGHAMLAVSLYGVLAYLSWKAIKKSSGRIFVLFLAGAMMVSIGASRIYLGVHYPSDVVAGMSISAIWFIISSVFYGAYERKRIKVRQQEAENPS